DTGEQRAVHYDGTPIAFSPEAIAASELAYRIWRKVGKGEAGITLITKYVGEQYLDNSGNPERALDAYVVNDLRLNLALTSFLRIPHIDFNLTVRNVFSELYESNG